MGNEANLTRGEGTNGIHVGKVLGSGNNAGEEHLGSPKLRGDRNQCAGCGEYFNSTSAFDKHRTGDFTSGERRCLGSEEMLERGMSRKADGFWVKKAFQGKADWWTGKD